MELDYVWMSEGRQFLVVQDLPYDILVDLAGLALPWQGDHGNGNIPPCDSCEHSWMQANLAKMNLAGNRTLSLILYMHTHSEDVLDSNKSIAVLAVLAEMNEALAPCKASARAAFGGGAARTMHAQTGQTAQTFAKISNLLESLNGLLRRGLNCKHHLNSRRSLDVEYHNSLQT
jgi:hypothetical protein